MIVKDEEKVIERALLSALPFIQGWVIVDTGSTDRTKEIIQAFFDQRGIPGKLYSREWVDFGYNRSEALKLCRNGELQLDWAIMLDADDTIEGQRLPDSLWVGDGTGANEPNGYTLQIKYQGHNFRRVQIFKLDAGWRYQHTVHEIAVCDSGAVLGHIPAEHTYMQARSEGAQSKNPIARAERDIRLLLLEPKNTHTLFHLANSYREAKQPDKALECYHEFVAIDSELIKPEKYISLVNIVYLSTDSKEQLDACRAAMTLSPLRLEAQYNLLYRYRYASASANGSLDLLDVYAIASAVTNRTPDLNNFMVTPAIYEWIFDYELIFVAFDSKHYNEAYEAAIRCLLNCPAIHRDTLIELAKLCKTKLA